MDLTDRGVEGREPPKPLDVFLTTERGIYRVGETVYATALVRDATAMAASGVPLTGDRHPARRQGARAASRSPTRDSAAACTPVNLPANAMRGTWRIGVYADVKGAALAETTFLVEDFDPERLDFDLKAEAEALDPDDAGGAQRRRALPLRRAGLRPQRRGRDGAEAGPQPRRVSRATSSASQDDPFSPSAEPFSGGTTDEAGHAVIGVDAAGHRRGRAGRSRRRSTCACSTPATARSSAT